MKQRKKTKIQDNTRSHTKKRKSKNNIHYLIQLWLVFILVYQKYIKECYWEKLRNVSERVREEIVIDRVRKHILASTNCTSMPVCVPGWEESGD